MRAAIYTRISVDADGAQTATHRQEKAAQAFAALREWDVVDVFEDVDVSAYNARVVRPDFERLIEEVAAGAVDVVVVWRLDRLVRRPADFERFWAKCEATHTAIVSVTEPIDTTSEIGLAMVRILVTFAGLESATKSARLKAKFAETARNGEPAYRRRVYGLNQSWTRLIPHEAAVIRDAATKVLADVPLKVIAADLNRRKVPSPGGRTWSRSGLRALLVATRLSGERWHQGEMVAKGNWPAVLDPLTAARVRAALADSGRRPDGHRARTPLLRNLLRCGKCGATLGLSGPSRGLYTCRGKPRSCGGVTVNAAAAEEWVMQAIHWRLSQPVDAVPAEGATAAAFERHAAALHELSMDYYSRRTITRPEFLATRRQLVDAAPQAPPGDVAEGRAESHGGSETLAPRQRQRLIARHLRSVTVRPNPKGGVFNPSRLIPDWRTPPPEDSSFVWAPQLVGGNASSASAGDRWLDLKEAGQRLGGVSICTVKRWCHKGVLPYSLDGRQFRLRVADVDAHIKACLVTPGTVRSVHPKRSRSSHAKAR